MKRVAVLLGGISNEREISLKSGRKIIENLDTSKYKISEYDPQSQIADLVRDAQAGLIDVAFIALHGKGGEDGAIQGLLEWLNLPYTGSGVEASALAMDKARTKALYRQNGIPTPPALIVKSFDLSTIKEALGDSIVIKPNADGSSVGVAVKPPESEWKSLIEARISAEGSCLIESFRSGREFTVGILGNEALPVVEIRPKTEFFDFEAKYTPGMSEEICPADLAPHVTRLAQTLALEAHQALGCRGYSRSDMILVPGRFELLETNTLPGMTETSLLPLAAKTAGISYPNLLDRMIELALA